MEWFVVMAVDSTCEPRKPSAGSSRAARCRPKIGDFRDHGRSKIFRTTRFAHCVRCSVLARRRRASGPRDLRLPLCLRHRESKALPSSRRMGPRTSGFPEWAVGFADCLMPWRLCRHAGLALSRLSRVIPRLIPLNHPYHARPSTPRRGRQYTNREIPLPAPVNREYAAIAPARRAGGARGRRTSRHPTRRRRPRSWLPSAPRSSPSRRRPSSPRPVPA